MIFQKKWLKWLKWIFCSIDLMSGSKNEPCFNALHSYVYVPHTAQLKQKFKHDLLFVPSGRSCTKNEKLYFDRRTAWFGLWYKKWWKNGIKNAKQPHDVKLKIHVSYTDVGAFTKRWDMGEKKNGRTKNWIDTFYSTDNYSEKRTRPHWKPISPFEYEISFSHYE